MVSSSNFQRWSSLQFLLFLFSKSGYYCRLLNLVVQHNNYRGSPHSTVFAPPGIRTIGKTVLIGDWFSTKIAIYDFWIVKVPFFAHFHVPRLEFWTVLLKKISIFVCLTAFLPFPKLLFCNHLQSWNAFQKLNLAFWLFLEISHWDFHHSQFENLKNRTRPGYEYYLVKI